MRQDKTIEAMCAGKSGSLAIVEPRHTNQSNSYSISFRRRRASGQRCVEGGRQVLCSRLATAEVAGVQAAVADGVLLAEPGEETLEPEAVAAVGRGTVSKGLC